MSIIEPPANTADLLKFIEQCRREETSEPAIEQYTLFAQTKGEELASCPELSSMILTLAFMQEVERTHEVIKHLANDHTQALASSPAFGNIIETLCRLNQEVEALQYLATCAEKECQTVIRNESLGRGLDALYRKEADMEVDSLMDWFKDGCDPETFPKFPRLEHILTYRVEAGINHAPIQR